MTDSIEQQNIIMGVPDIEDHNIIFDNVKIDINGRIRSGNFATTQAYYDDFRIAFDMRSSLGTKHIQSQDWYKKSGVYIEFNIEDFRSEDNIAEVYVGQTTQGTRGLGVRLTEHTKMATEADKRNFEHWNYFVTLYTYNESFSRDQLCYLENSLYKLFEADNRFKLLNKVEPATAIRLSRDMLDEANYALYFLFTIIQSKA